MTAPDRVALAVAVAAGGALGGTARYGVTRIVADGAGGFPWSTLLVNTVGSLVLGSAVAVAVAAARWPAAHRLLAFAGVGVCGGFTTWSTFMTRCCSGVTVTGRWPPATWWSRWSPGWRPWCRASWWGAGWPRRGGGGRGPVVVAVAAAAALGSVCRWLVDAAVRRRVGDRTPLGILAVNLTGSLALGR
ncbi:MAG TPA: CrcB family protein [Acidimicrobiales bacterium]|nr:CrcB family protein [Acidimicrobiales bacterium]